MRFKNIKQLVLLVVSLLGYCNAVQAVQVKFILPAAVEELRVTTTIQRVEYDEDGTYQYETTNSESEDYVNSTDGISVNLLGTDNYEDTYKVYSDDVVSLNDDGTLTISYQNGWHSVISFSYSWSYRRHNDYSYSWYEGGDITDQVKKDAIIDLRKHFPAEYKLTVNVVDENGKSADDVYVHVVKGNEHVYNELHPQNGKITVSLEEGDYKIIASPYSYYDEDGDGDYASQTISLKGDMSVNLTVPNQISFRVTIDGKPDSIYGYYGDKKHVRFYSEYRHSIPTIYENGMYKCRVKNNSVCRVWCNAFNVYGFEDIMYETNDDFYVKGTTKLTDGGTIRIATFDVQAVGNGLAFPREPFGGRSYYRVIVGNPVRLAAVPVGDSKFVSWTINGKEYTDPLIDFTVKDDITTATANFSGEIINRVKAANSSIETIAVRLEGNYLVLPTDVEATACIYATDGHLVKRTGVVGNRINISDLPTASYVLRLSAEGLLQSAQFVKQ